MKKIRSDESIKIKNKKINEIKYYEKQCRYEDALVLIDNFLYEFPDNNYIKVYKCLMMLKLAKIEEAESLILKIFENSSLKGSDKIFAYNVYGKILKSSKRYDEAITIYEKIINESDEIELVSRNELSLIYMEKNRENDALNVLRIPGYNSRFLNIRRGYIYSKMHKYDMILPALEEPEYNKFSHFECENFGDSYLKQNENFLKGYAYFKDEKFDDALRYLYEALMPKNNYLYYRSYVTIAKIKLMRSRVDEAIDICNNLLNNNPINRIKPIIYDVLSKAYIRKNDYETAKDKLEGNEFNREKTNIAFAKIEISKGNFEEAEKYLSFLDFDEYDIYNYYDGYYRLALVKFRLGKFEEFKKIEDYFFSCLDTRIIKNIKYELDRMHLMIDLKEGKNIPKNSNKKYTYSEKQIISYDEEKAIEHIITHHVSDYRVSSFNANIDTVSLFNYAREAIKNLKPTCDSSYDRYTLKYNNVGKNLEGDNINQLLVVTIPDTDKIITMYPYDGFESLLIIDEENEVCKPKIKRLTQIEKFNKKYNKKS